MNRFAFILLCLLIAAPLLAEDTKSLGFKGLHLKMTDAELDEAIQKKEIPFASTSITGEIDSVKGYELVHLQKHPLFENNGDQIGCDGLNRCYYLDDILIKLFEGKIMFIQLSSPAYSADYINTTLTEWGKFALKGLIKKYGQPSKTYLALDKVNIFSFDPGVYNYFYEWGKGKEKIRMAGVISDFKYSINILYSDEVAQNKYKKLKEESKTNLSLLQKYKKVVIPALFKRESGVLL